MPDGRRRQRPCQRAGLAPGRRDQRRRGQRSGLGTPRRTRGMNCASHASARSRSASVPPCNSTRPSRYLTSRAPPKPARVSPGSPSGVYCLRMVASVPPGVGQRQGYPDNWIEPPEPTPVAWVCRRWPPAGGGNPTRTTAGVRRWSGREPVRLAAQVQRPGRRGGGGGDGDEGAGGFVISHSAGGNFTQKGPARTRPSSQGRPADGAGRSPRLRASRPFGASVGHGRGNTCEVSIASPASPRRMPRQTS